MKDRGAKLETELKTMTETDRRAINWILAADESGLRPQAVVGSSPGGAVVMYLHCAHDAAAAGLLEPDADDRVYRAILLWLFSSGRVVDMGSGAIH